MKDLYKSRIRKVIKTLLATKTPSALLVSSAPFAPRSRDTFHPYRQNSDFFYLTGSLEPAQHLLISTEEEKPLLFTEPVNAHKVVWDGKPVSPKPLARSLGATLETVSDIPQEIKKKLRPIHSLYYQSESDPQVFRMVNELFGLPSHQRLTSPRSFHHVDTILEPLRVRKSRHEISEIKRAAEVTWESLQHTAQMVEPGLREHEVLATLEYHMRLFGCEPSFSTIVASGASAATLHYQAHTQKLKKGELLLLDFGAEYNMYAADVTRMLPVTGTFTGILAELYDCVLEAQLKSIAAVRSGVTIQKVYNAAARVLIDGLKDFGVLRGNTSALLEKRAHLPYFPHGIGHGLGLDVHDVGRLRGTNKPKLQEGMVFTIEPGLYFPRPVGKLPACGIRIEDDVVVRKSGCEVLTRMIPKERSKIEDLMA